MACLIAKPLIRDPGIYVDPDGMAKYLINHPSFFEFELLSHVFSIARSRYWELDFDNYIKETLKAKQQFFTGYNLINRFDDIDFTLRILQD